ncbi:MAG: hypothetical protein ACJ76J_22320 [Thermoanaerobaculia bacterium]
MTPTRRGGQGLEQAELVSPEWIGSKPCPPPRALDEQAADRLLDLLGGNQGNQVKIQSFPASQLLGYRWPQA